jgi:hypothetical protein
MGVLHGLPKKLRKYTPIPCNATLPFHVTPQSFEEIENNLVVQL